MQTKIAFLSGKICAAASKAKANRHQMSFNRPIIKSASVQALFHSLKVNMSPIRKTSMPYFIAKQFYFFQYSFTPSTSQVMLSGMLKPFTANIFYKDSYSGCKKVWETWSFERKRAFSKNPNRDYIFQFYSFNITIFKQS